MFTKVIITLISPLGSALLFSLVGAMICLRSRSRFGAAVILAALGWLWLWSMPLTSRGLRSGLEASFPPQTAETTATAGAIVVLGGAIGSAEGGRLYPHLGESSDRLWHAARLYHSGKAPLLVLSGGNLPWLGSASEAEAMRAFLRDLGVPDSAMILESRSGSTRENAVFSAQILHARGIQDVLLVTSARHMTRALPLFEAQGVHAVAAATDYAGAPISGWLRFLPDASALADSTASMKELVGRWAG